MTIQNILFLVLNIFWVFVILDTIKQWKKLERKHKEQMKIMKSEGRILSEKAHLAEFKLKEASYLSKEVKREHRKIKDTNRLIEKAIKAKVNKKKIRGKRRKKTA